MQIYLEDLILKVKKNLIQKIKVAIIFRASFSYLYGDNITGWVNLLAMGKDEVGVTFSTFSSPGGNILNTDL